MEIGLGLIVTDWLIDKKFPVKIYQSSIGSTRRGNEGILWVDLDLRKPEYPKSVNCPLLAIVDDNEPYVTLLDDRMRSQEFYMPAHPEFFTQIENAINKAIKMYLDGRGS